MRITDGMGQAVLEENTAVNVLGSVIENYTENETIRNKRILTEGKQVPLNLTGGNSLYYANEPDWTTTTITANAAQKNVEMELPFTYSGLLGSNLVLPVVAMNGINIQLNIDSLERTLDCSSGRFSDLSKQADRTLASQDYFATSATAKNPASATANEKDVKTAIDTVFTMTCQNTGNNPTNANNQYFKIGDELMVSLADFTELYSLGMITQLESVGGDLKISYIPNVAIGAALPRAYPVGSHLFYNETKRIDGYVGDGANLPATISLTKPSVEITDVKLVFNQISPPADYVKGLLAQVQSANGLNLDFRSWVNVRNTLSAKNGQLDQLITQNYHGVYSLLALPTDIAKFNNLADDPFLPAVDGQVDYTMIYRGQNITSRPVPIKRYALLPPKVSPLHLHEAEKSLDSAGYPPRNLRQIRDRFFVGRAFAKRPAVADLSDGDLRMKVFYQNATTQKQWDCFLCINSRLNVRGESIRVDR
tara:strand:- start:241 stop:1677 length:1437 start_codon:yes stop_codon:yes gene_type:complete